MLQLDSGTSKLSSTGEGQADLAGLRTVDEGADADRPQAGLVEPNQRDTANDPEGCTLDDLLEQDGDFTDFDEGRRDEKIGLKPLAKDVREESGRPRNGMDGTKRSEEARPGIRSNPYSKAEREAGRQSSSQGPAEYEPAAQRPGKRIRLPTDDKPHHDSSSKWHTGRSKAPQHTFGAKGSSWKNDVNGNSGKRKHRHES
ncbi:hypothetical protein CYMTET_12005 [Cymbomonas tetramitiformis]|uniref:Uncharacterized protein n=1 Tax=Cymbomonas tetramitiformis TaxID=36881 RepID=A0AAE0LCH7_9CHLO|nr:hypothetical protein CYMTET_12005 [Cymbomonas tetramitiformis]